MIFFAFILSVFTTVFSIGCIFSIDYNVIQIFFEFILFIQIIYLICKAIKNKGVFSLYVCFLFTSCFFLLDRFFLHLFFRFDYLKILFPGKYQILPITAIECIFVLSCCYLFIDIGIYRKPFVVKRYELTFPKIYSQLLYTSILILFPVFLYRQYLVFRYSMSVGYIYFTQHIDEVPLPFLLRHIGGIYYILFFTYLMTKPSDKKLKLVLILFIIQALANSLKGSRSAFGYTLIFVIWYWNKFCLKKIKVKYIIIVFIGFVLFYFVSSLNRGNNSVASTVNVKDLIILILEEQGITLNMLLYHIQNYAEVSNARILPFVISDYLQLVFNIKIPSEKIIDSMISPLAQKRGFGLGYSIGSEFIDLNIFGFAMAYLLGKFISFIEVNAKRNSLLIPFFSVCVMFIVYSPRHIFLGFLAKECIVWFVFPILFYLFSKTFFKYLISTRRYA